MYKDLKTATRHVLGRAGILTDAAIASKTREELLKIRNFGEAMLDEVDQKVRIPMGLPPFTKPVTKRRHPNNQAAIDRYWKRYHQGLEPTRKGKRR